MKFSKKKIFLAGFTLIELLVTFSLISLISGVGFASFVSYSRRQAVMQQAYDLKQAVDLARFDALASVKPEACASYDLTSYYINICMNNISGCQTEDVDYEVVAQCTSVSEVVFSHKLPTNVTLSNQDIDPSDRCVNPTFSTSTDDAINVPCEIYLEGYGNDVKATIDTNGYVSFD